MPRRRRVLLPTVLAVWVLAGGGGARAFGATPAGDQQATLRQMTEAQKWLGEEVWKIKEQVEALPGVIAEAKEGHTETQEEIGKLRDEVKGLYVEISTVKQQIDTLKGDIGSVNANVSGFRTYSGFFLALMLLMVAVMFAMTIRR